MALVQLDVEATRLLQLNWFLRLAGEAGLELNNQWGGSGSHLHRLGDPNGFHVEATPTDEPPWLRFVSSHEAEQELVDDIAEKAASHSLAQDYGGVVWHSASLQTAATFFDNAFFLTGLQRLLGDQTRISRLAKARERRSP